MRTHTIIQSHSPLDQIRQRRLTAEQPALHRLSPDQQADLSAILSCEPDFVDDPSFTKRNAESLLFDQAPDIPDPNTSWYHPVMENLSDARSARGVVNVVLTKEQEQALFLQYNYARFRLAKLRNAIGDRPATDDEADDLLAWYYKARHLRDRIAQFNLALVLAMAKRIRGTDLDFADLISEGNMALLRAVDKFNASKGFKFSTYACRAILKAFSRTGMKHSQYKSMFPTDFDPALEKSDHQERKNSGHENDCADEVKRIVLDNDADLTDVEQQVIEHRFAIRRAGAAMTGPLTLEQVGKLVGLTKERVRQIQNKALAKIRRTLEDQYLDGPHADDDEEDTA